ncbi:bifunctional biotin--[acetyl-CoA-carboxylase] synthetase/biotin operon repressor [Vibrio nigripulchritudo ATCC 27043]|uniref:Bifunctional ligase/repressor BirA n=1 Tax=Vibrio nigripulchritudo TaxID=28173 RepID=U4K262_9VIBR|nr:bifunctional biotin--[acetyl-CoA-carboxylase] ligase/biotin operon repressor BirA [Vibrio nigripulchritudo]EGU59568.1 bifunctional biotin--[acetyl-CoA-carboxylase] synthetase/biotin operon repressor [Vibrio nigripulchritudo ATCC 27043]CCN34156.1 Bifunctional protein birA (Includes: Biotin operon repressor; Biotin--(acetyl-CoA-carboxylase) synthetase) [Vibrio nigripulchritudo AM115]CCN40968.1 Bifunctional protein birA (Includes: Biotin operon repressor; Biotin--(acetyl-CoA-carboxylase) synthet
MKVDSVKYNIIKQLADGEFHSGEALGEKFGISRAAISKHIKSIQELGLDVYSVQRKGYRLPSPLSLLDEALLSSGSQRSLKVFPVIGSTNQYLLERTHELNSGDACLAEYQSQGRGRRGRQWVSPFGSNLYVSMFWRLEAGMAAAMGLSLVVGVSVVEAFESLGIHGVKLKWPNDLYYQDKKLAGILVEISGQAGAAANLVIGMGLNIAMPDSTENITQPWTSLGQILPNENIDRNALASAILTAWERSLNDYEVNGMKGFVERWNRLDNFLDRPVKLIMGPKELKGIAKGIDEQGGILIETENGVETFIGGEISLRGAE